MPITPTPSPAPLTRRSFAAGLLGRIAAAAPVRRPNVLLLAIDDMNDWLGCLGYGPARTPRIDALARGGALFANAHCASPLCNPSRTALLTGQAPERTGIYDNEQFLRPNHPDLVTLPQHFRRNGYHVAGAGKIFHHTAGMNSPDQWDDFQLQVFDDLWYRRDDWYPWNKKVPVPAGHPFNGLRDFAGEFDWGVPPAAEAEYGDMRAVRYAQKVLQSRHDKPFFLAAGLWHPHIPMYSPRRFFDLHPESSVVMPRTIPNDLDDLPEAGRNLAAFRRAEFERIVKEGKWRDCVRAYMAAISFADFMAGEILDSLARSPHRTNTIVVLLSDNGWHLGEKEHFHKSTLWRRSTHVPLIISGPGIKRPGAARTQPVSHLDVYPTLTDLCGLDRPGVLDGISLRPLLENPRASRGPAVVTFGPSNFAVLKGRWRLIRYAGGGEELYDDTADPDNFHNLASRTDHDSIRAELRAHVPVNVAPPVPSRTEFDFDFASHTYRRKG